MADEIVIRIEGDDDDADKLNPPDWMTDEDWQRLSPRGQRQMVSGIVEDEEWLESLSDFGRQQADNLNLYRNIQNNAASPPQEVESGENECECAPYFERIISILGSIWNAQIVPRNPGTPNGPRDPADGFGQLLANQIGEQLANAIAQINLAQFLNDPISATTSTIANVGNALGTTANVLTTAAMTAILTPILGPLAPAIGGIIGAVAGEAIGQFFSNIAEGIQSFFDYANRQAQELAPFSPEIISAQVDRQLSLLNFRVDAGQNFGQQFADIYSAQSDLLLELEKLKLELFSRFQPYFEEGVKSIADVVAVIRIIIDEGDFSILRAMFDALFSMSNTITGPISAVLENLTADLAILAREARRSRELDQQLQAGNVNREVLKFFGWQP